MLQAHTSFVVSVATSPDAKHIVSGSWDNTTKIWSIEAGRKTATLEGHADSVNSVSISADGKYIVSASEDKTIKIWGNDE